MAKRKQTEKAFTGEVTPTQADPEPGGEIQRALPFGLDAFLTEPRLMPGESPKVYEAIRNCFLEQIKPADAVEALWANDIVNLTWKSRRYSAMFDQLLRRAHVSVVSDLLQEAFQVAAMMDPGVDTRGSADRMAAGWSKGTKQGQEEVTEILEEKGLDTDDIAARAAEVGLSTLEKLNRLVMMTDRRRDSLLREIERKREGARRQLRFAAADVVDAEVTAPSTSARSGREP